jgi:diacylglycerol kinase (ATP)
MARRVALLVNPAAGRGRGMVVARYVADRLRADGDEVRILAGRNAPEAATQARRAATEHVEALVAVGGDGMVHLALQAVAGTSVPLGVVPAGTGNDVARMLGIPHGRTPAAAAAAVDVLRRGGVRRIDAGKVDDRWFLSVLSSGFDSRVNERANRMSWLSGRIRYDMAIAAELRTFRPVPYVITLDEEELRTGAMLVAVGNCQSYGGGMRVCPYADVADGLFDVTILTPVSTLTFLRLLPTVFQGRHVRHPAVLTRRARRVTLSAAGMTAYADGERVGVLPVTADVVPQSVTVLAPRDGAVPRER